MKSADLEKFECVRTWLNAIHARGTGSPGTRKIYLKSLRYFLDFSGLDPDALVGLARSDPAKLKAKLNDFVVHRDGQGRSRKYTRDTFAVVMSFLRENEAAIGARCPKAFALSRKARLTADDINKLMAFADLRLRAFIACMKDCGMAPVDVLKLTYGDVRKDLEANRIPIFIARIRTKTKADFETFLGPDAAEHLRNYLDSRRRGTDKVAPEELGDKSPLFIIAGTGQAISSESLFKSFIRARRQAGVSWTPYTLRAFFNTNMKAAGVNDTLVEYWMGHKLPAQIDPYLFSPENQDKIYMSAYPRISLKGEQDLEKLRKQQLLDTARLLGIPQEKLDKLRELIEAREFGEDLLEEVAAVLQNNRQNGSHKGGSKYVTEEELPAYIEDGWEFVAQVNGRILIKR